jgi:hypothetical protein
MKYVLTIGIDKFNLTQEEADFYIKAVDNGMKYVKIGDMVLGTSFQTLVPLERTQEAKRLAEGQFKCSFGKWHDKGDQCIHYFSLENKMKSIKEILENNQNT